MAIGCLSVMPGSAAPPSARDAADSNDLRGAMPASAAGRLPSTAAQYRALQAEIARSRPAVADAKRRSDVLKAEAQSLKRRLIDTAARIQALEAEKLGLDQAVAKLARDERELSQSFLEQRAKVAQLLAALERMQHDVPPVMAIRAGDALAAAHSSMLLGAILPRLYNGAAELSRQLGALQRTRANLTRKRAEAAQYSAALDRARQDLDQLLAMKSKQAEEAGSRYDDLAGKLGTASEEAADLDALLRRVAGLRAEPAPQSVVVVSSRASDAKPGFHALLRPVVGRAENGDGAPTGAPQAPGMSFLAPSAAQVVAPVDSRVLFAGPYHKNGQVLILRTASGYDLVLAGLGRVDVRAGNQLLAGEPVGRMPRNGAEERLYFELRQNGKGVNPAPWLGIELRKVSKS